LRLRSRQPRSCTERDNAQSSCSELPPKDQAGSGVMPRISGRCAHQPALPGIRSPATYGRPAIVRRSRRRPRSVADTVRTTVRCRARLQSTPPKCTNATSGERPARSRVDRVGADQKHLPIARAGRDRRQNGRAGRRSGNGQAGAVVGHTNSLERDYRPQSDDDGVSRRKSFVPPTGRFAGHPRHVRRHDEPGSKPRAVGTQRNPGRRRSSVPARRSGARFLADCIQCGSCMAFSPESVADERFAVHSDVMSSSGVGGAYLGCAKTAVVVDGRAPRSPRRNVTHTGEVPKGGT
jgi:hypothetical protein